MSPTFSAFTASIVNNANTAGTGTVSMQETTGTGTGPNSCSSGLGTANCSTINKYGGSTSLTPTAGSNTSTTIVTIKNTGTVTPGTFSLTAGTCQPSAIGPVAGTGDLCTKLNVKITTGTTTVTTVYDGLASALTGAKTLVPMAPNTATAYTFVVSLPTTLDNSYQGLQAAQTLTWTFSA